MTNQMEISKAVEAVTIEAVEDMQMESLNGVKITPTNFNMFVDITLSIFGITFENDNAKSFFVMAVKKLTSSKFPEIYAIMHPPVAMDQNGNYTHDQSKWA